MFTAPPARPVPVLMLIEPLFCALVFPVSTEMAPLDPVDVVPDVTFKLPLVDPTEDNSEISFAASTRILPAVVCAAPPFATKSPAAVETVFPDTLLVSPDTSLAVPENN